MIILDRKECRKQEEILRGITDIDFSVPVDCSNTADSGIGASCDVGTTANAVIPGLINEDKQAIMDAWRVRVNDSGQNGIRRLLPDLKREM